MEQRLLIALLLPLAIQLQAETLALAGDSTVATYSSGTKQGWGASLSKFVTSKLKVNNYAAGGRTTKSFRSEGRWNNILKAKPNFVFVQFGHNDSGSNHHVELSEYKSLLQKYIDDADSKNIDILFVTPPHRCRFSGSKVTEEMKSYVSAMKSVAAANDVPVLDLYKKSAEFLNSQGTKACKEYFVSGDQTHFNKKGSEKMASLVAAEAKLDSVIGKFFK